MRVVTLGYCMTNPQERPGTNPIAEIINNKVQALADLGGSGKWCGVIAYADDHPSRAGEPILETPAMYDSEDHAKTAMTVEISRILDAAETFRAADENESKPE